MTEAKKLRLNMFKCSKFSLFYQKKNIITPKKIPKTAKKLHYLE